MASIAFPNVDIPTISVTTRLPGAAPEQIETEVTDKIEESVNTISGIDTLTSTSSEGISQVVVSFKLEKNADIAAQEVRDRINRVLPQLPRTVLQPTVEKLDFSAAPVITVAVTADKPVRDITEFADKILRRRLESSDGVGQVVVIGGRSRQVNIWLDTALLRAQKLSVNDVARALQSQNADIPGGRMDQGARVGDAAHARPPRVDRRASATWCCARWRATRFGLRDVARVEDGMAEPRTQASVNGEPTVLLQIRKQSGTNTVEVANNVKQRLADLQGILPAGYQLRIVRDEAQFIEASIASVQEHLVVGSILAAIVVWLFLGNFRSTVIAAISIPTSIIATFALVWYMGFTLNMLTMLALTLSVGIVIDDAIVVLENIFRFIEEKGMPPMQAAVEATQGNRPRRDGHDVVARRDLRAGRLHERHGRPLHAEFRPDDGVCRDGVAVCELHADADDVGLLAQAAAEGRASRFEAQQVVRSARSRLHAHARLGDGASRPGGGRRRAGVAVERSAVPHHRRQLHAGRRSVAVRRHDARARGHQPGVDGSAGQPREHGGAPDSRSGLHAGHRGRRCRRHVEHRQHAGAPASDRGARRAISSRSWRRSANEILPAYTKAGIRTAVQQGGGPGGGGGGIQFMVQGPDLKQLEKYSEQLRAEGAAPFRGWSTSTPR